MSTAGTIYEALRDKGQNGGVLRWGGDFRTLTYRPYDGDRLKINGVWQTIPSSGVAGLADTNCFVNGVAAQNLADSTFYYVYAFMNGSVLTADFSATAHATSMTVGNVGNEIKQGDDSRTLIGMVWHYQGPSVPGQGFLDDPKNRLVRSWHNRSGQRRDLRANTGTYYGTTSQTLIEVSTTLRCYFLAWANEKIHTALAAISWGDGGSASGQGNWNAMYYSISMDSAMISVEINTEWYGNQYENGYLAEVRSPPSPENIRHFVSPAYSVAGGYNHYCGYTSATASFNGAISE